VIAILGGLGAAFLWAAANLASARSSRLIGASSALAWMMLIGLVVTAPLVPFAGPLPPLTPALAFWLAASGLGSVIGLFFVYRGLRIGKVGPVLAIASTEGAIAAVVAVIAGERLTIPVALMLGVIAVAIAVVALATGDVAVSPAVAVTPWSPDAPAAAPSGRQPCSGPRGRLPLDSASTAPRRRA
jgi:uncharacterized membrane protein